MNDPHEAFEADLDGLPVPADPEHLQARETLEVLLSRFTEQVRRGENPSVEDYARRHREWSAEILELFPLISSLEHWKSASEAECLRRNIPEKFPVRRLGAYHLIRELGRGGMGIVFEAVREQPERRRAVKLLPWRYAGDMPRWKARFHREAATIARLRHRNIVRVYSFGVDQGYCFYVMQLVYGVSLDRILRTWRDSVTGVVDVEALRLTVFNGTAEPGAADRVGLMLRRDDWQAFARIGMQVAQALGHAHQHGVLHHDIKPANLLLKSDGHVIVTDFGVGREREDGSGFESGTGTLRYMAPERLLGISDARSDIYALGMTLYELVTQTPAFDGPDRMQLAQRILQSQPRRPRELARRLPRGLETIILNAIAPNSADRYASAELLAADLQRFLNGEHIRSTRPTRLQRALRWCHDLAKHF